MRRVRRRVQAQLRQALRGMSGGAARRDDALVVMSAAAGSLGDQAMLQSVADNLELMGLRYVRQVLMPNWGEFAVKGPMLPSLRFSVEEVEAKSARVVAAVRDAGAVLAVGADIIDGYYGLHPVRYQIGMLRIAAEQGRPAILLGHSISEQPHPEAVQMIESLPSSVAIYVRDPISHARFERFIGRKATLVADVAFLVQPDRTSNDGRQAAQWIAARRAAGDLVLCLNVSGLNAEKQSAGLGVQEYWSAFVQGFLSLHPNTSFLFLSHDNRSNSSDASMQREVIATLPTGLRQRVHAVDTPETAAIAKSISGMADMVFAGRMHLAIGALSQAVPTFCIAYVGKYEGLAEHLRIPDFIPDAQVLEQPHTLAAWLASKVPDLQQRRKALQDRLPAVKAMSKMNYSSVNQRSGAASGAAG